MAVSTINILIICGTLLLFYMIGEFGGKGE